MGAVVDIYTARENPAQTRTIGYTKRRSSKRLNRLDTSSACLLAQG